MENKITAEGIIKILQLQPLRPEGGFYRQTYCLVDPASEKIMATSIYFLLTNKPEGYSKLHRLPKDEIYHFYSGDPVFLFFITPDQNPHRVILGNDINRGEIPQQLIPAGSWQGSRLITGGEYALLGTTMTPGYVDEDFELADIARLCRQYPCFKEDIMLFSP